MSTCTRPASTASSATTVVPWSITSERWNLAEEGLDDIHLDLAFEYENLEAFDLAIDSLQQALEMNPENEAVLYELAYCYDLADAHQSAVSLLPGVHQRAPLFLRGVVQPGQCAWPAWIAWRRASRPWTTAWPSRNASPRPISARRGTCSSKGNFQEAIDCYQETIAIDGPQAITFSYIGECYEKMERLRAGADPLRPGHWHWTRTGWMPGSVVAW